MNRAGALVLGLLARCAWAKTVSFTLEPQDTWEKVKEELSQLEAAHSSALEEFHKKVPKVYPPSGAAMNVTPWTWYDLDADFQRGIEGVKPGRALDLGSGDGYQSLGLAKRGWETVGVEFEESGVGRAKDNAQQQGVSNVKFLPGSVLTPTKLLSSPEFGRNSFDLIIDRGCLHGNVGLDKNIVSALYFFTIRYLLKPGGLFLIKTVHPNFHRGIAQSIIRHMKMQRYHASMEQNLKPIFMMSMFLMTPTGHFSPVRPFGFTAEALEKLASPHLTISEVDDDRLIQSVANDTIVMFNKLPIEATYLAARAPTGVIRIESTPADNPMMGWHHIKDYMTPKQLKEYQGIMASAPKKPGPGMGKPGPGMGKPGPPEGGRSEL